MSEPRWSNLWGIDPTFTDQPVTPDREALVRRGAVSMANVMRLPEWMQMPALGHDMTPVAELVVDANLPLLTEALDRAREQGWRDHWEYVIRGGGSDLGEPGDLDQLRAELAQVKAATRFADLVELAAERDAALALLRQVREATGHVEWAHDICHIIDEAYLLDDEGQQR